MCLFLFPSLLFQVANLDDFLFLLFMLEFEWCNCSSFLLMLISVYVICLKLHVVVITFSALFCLQRMYCEYDLIFWSVTSTNLVVYGYTYL